MKKILSLCLCFIMLVGIFTPSFAIQNNSLNDVISDTAEYMGRNLKKTSIGSEWTILGLARSGVNISKDFYENYYKNIEQEVKKRNGKLHDKKYTEYSRVIIALTAIGKDPINVGGYNLLMPLADYQNTIWQGINGAAWALIALDCGDYEIPQNTNASIQATKEMYINYVLQCQKNDGGWALSGESSDIDVTSMVLQGLSKYQHIEKVKIAIEKALIYISKNQNTNGGFLTFGEETSESTSQVIVALCELGIPLEDTRFVKNGKTLLDNLISYYINENGFKHTYADASSNQMATEQAFYSLVAAKRFLEGKNSLYSMNDVKDNKTSISFGLPNKNTDIKKMDVVLNNKTFNDIKVHQSKKAIEELAKRNIISGKSIDFFEPNSTITRAEFATIIVKGLGLPLKSKEAFLDVTKNEWFFDYVNTAYKYNIVSGISATQFNPNGMITREEAATMIAKSSKLCGLDTNLEVYEVRDILSGFSDYIKVSNWAMNNLAFCYDNKILSDDVMKINPKEKVTRAEIAQMIYNMLELSNLL